MVIQRAADASVNADFYRFSYYPCKDSAEVGLLFEDSATFGDLRLGGDEIPQRYEKTPTAELLVASHIDQDELTLTISRLTNTQVGRRLLELRQSLRVDRFPQRAYDRLDSESQQQVRDLIRKLAIGSVR